MACGGQQLKLRHDLDGCPLGFWPDHNNDRTLTFFATNLSKRTTLIAFAAIIQILNQESVADYVETTEMSSRFHFKKRRSSLSLYTRVADPENSVFSLALLS